MANELYKQELKEKVQPGETLTVKGTTGNSCKSFTVNLTSVTTGYEVHIGFIPLHINVRFEENIVCLNSYQGGKWFDEVRVSNPFKNGQKFDVRIRAHEKKYEIFANRTFLANFEHRFPLQSVDHVVLESQGEVILDEDIMPLKWRGTYYRIPHEMSLDPCLREGATVKICGIPNGDRFEIDLLDKNGTIALHFNVRLADGVVVRNAQQIKDGQWGREEREGECRFGSGRLFELALRNEPYSMQIYVDGSRMCTFSHRVPDPLADYVNLRVAGDVDIFDIEIL